MGKEAMQEQQEVKSKGKVTVMDGTSEGALRSPGAERDSNHKKRIIHPSVYPSIHLPYLRSRRLPPLESGDRGRRARGPSE